jgi:hypothetical protein
VNSGSLSEVTAGRARPRLRIECMPLRREGSTCVKTRRKSKSRYVGAASTHALIIIVHMHSDLMSLLGQGASTCRGNATSYDRRARVQPYAPDDLSGANESFSHPGTECCSSAAKDKEQMYLRGVARGENLRYIKSPVWCCRHRSLAWFPASLDTEMASSGKA